MCLQVGIILDGGEELESPNTITPRPGTVNKPELGKGAHFFSSPIVGASLILIRSERLRLCLSSPSPRLILAHSCITEASTNGTTGRLSHTPV